MGHSEVNVGAGEISAAEIATFEGQGYLVVREFLTRDIAERMRALLAADQAVSANAYERLDSSGRRSRVTLWYTPGNDVFGRLSCSSRMLATLATLLGGPVSFFHAKLMQKEARQGGAWEWHQDYGYWYDDGFLTDAMASCYVALDAATRDNGALEVIPASHRFGRLRHRTVGEQRGADIGRVQALRDRLGVRCCELAPGDALFFHASLLHSSPPNLSDRSRWGLISSFFRTDNVSILEDPRFHPKQTAVVPHDAIMAGGTSLSLEGGDFLAQPDGP